MTTAASCLAFVLGFAAGSIAMDYLYYCKFKKTLDKNED